MFRRSKKNTESLVATLLAALTGIACIGVVETNTANANVNGEPYYIGDVNYDGTVDGRDASDVLTYYAKVSAGDQSVSISSYGDVDGDGIVDAVDASTILTAYSKEAVGKSFVWPIAKSSNLVNGNFTERLHTGMVWPVKAGPSNDAKTVYVLNEDDQFQFCVKRYEYPKGWYLIVFNGGKSKGFMYFDSEEEFNEVVQEQVAVPGGFWIG